MSEFLGHYNFISHADNVYLNMRDAAGVTFFCYENGGATDITFHEAQTQAGGSAQVFDTITRFYASSGDDGIWTKEDQAASELVEPSDDAEQDLVAIYVDASAMEGGFEYIRCNSDGGTVIVAAVVQMQVQRGPENFTALNT